MRDNSFPKTDRIRKRNEFQELYQTGRRYSTRFYQIFYIRSQSPKLGISVPGRLGNAVFRNYHKRVLRAFYRKEIKPLGISLELLFVLRKRPETREEHRDDLKKVLEWLTRTDPSSAK
jgi:ribonuclease P protein component